MRLGNFSAGPTSVRGRYLLAVFASAFFVALRLLLEPLLQNQAPLLALLAAPIIVAWLAGMGPAVFATLLCALAGEFLFVGDSSLVPTNAAEWLRLAIFLCYGVLFGWLIHLRRSAMVHLASKHEELSSAEQRARETLEAAPSGMVVVNECGRIESVNAQAERLFGYSREELLGLSIDQLVPEPGRGGHASFRARYHEAATQRPMGTAKAALFARRRDGSVFPVEIGLNPLQGSSAGLVLASVLDVSQRHDAEQALREADRRKDEFISLLAHELRNPLAPVRNSVEIVKRLAPGDARLQRAVDIIDRQVTHMARLLDDLLDVSRIARGKVELRLERCDLAVLSGEVAEDYRASLEAAGLSLLVRERSGPLWVDGDPVRLAQVMGNLLTNAQRFNQEGGSIEVVIDADPEMKSAVIKVANSGVGMDAPMLSRLFAPFQQAEQDLARSKGGLGLGLALTKGLAELHGGTITAQSEGFGRGAVFTMKLPLALSDVDLPRPDAFEIHFDRRESRYAVPPKAPPANAGAACSRTGVLQPPL
jgi:PAS domain S-box-containing protein